MGTKTLTSADEGELVRALVKSKLANQAIRRRLRNMIEAGRGKQVIEEITQEVMREVYDLVDETKGVDIEARMGEGGRLEATITVDPEINPGLAASLRQVIDEEE